MKILAAKKEEKSLELGILEDIGMWGGVTSGEVARVLKDAGDVSRIVVNLNSLGGDVHEGVAIMNLLKAHKAVVEVHVLGFALSAASIVAMGGDRVVMHESAMMMIHDAWTFLYGDAETLRKEAGILEKVSGEIAGLYARRSGKGVDEIKALMKEETWFTGAEAVEAGLADVSDVKSADDKKAAAGASPRASGEVWERFGYRNVPAALKVDPSPKNDEESKKVLQSSGEGEIRDNKPDEVADMKRRAKALGFEVRKVQIGV